MSIGHLGGWRQPKLPVRGRRLALHPDVVDALPPAIDLRPHFGPVRDQGQLGACVGFATAGALQALAHRQDMDAVSPSPLWIYYRSREREGLQFEDSGTTITDASGVVSSLGFAEEDEWPYVIDAYSVEPPAMTSVSRRQLVNHEMLAHHEATLLSTLAMGFPLVIGVAVYPSFAEFVPIPSNDEDPLGGHAIVIVGYDRPTRKFRFRNSWGTGWGTSGGYGTIPFDYVLDPGLCGEIAAFRTIDLAP